MVGIGEEPAKDGMGKTATPGGTAANTGDRMPEVETAILVLVEVEAEESTRRVVGLP